MSHGNSEPVFYTWEPSAEYLRRSGSEVGAGVIGRSPFDLTNGWNGRPATPSWWSPLRSADREFADQAPCHFVDGVGAAIAPAREPAKDRAVSETSGDVEDQPMAAGQVDEVGVDLVPVVLRRGVRCSGDFTDGPQLPGDPEIIAGERVTHLIFPVQHNVQLAAVTRPGRPTTAR